MLVLGLCCGHDSSAALIKDGVILAHALGERLSRQRHARGLREATITQALTAAGVTPDEIDAVAIAANHGEPLLMEETELFELDCQGSDILQKSIAPQAPDEKWTSVLWRSPRQAPASWETVPKIANLSTYLARHAAEMIERRMTMSLPIKALIQGRAVPGILVDHHAAHAAATYYTSPFTEAAVMTLDSGEEMDSGLVFAGQDQYLFPLAPHHLEIAALLDQAATRLGFETDGAEKLMNLAPYGIPLAGVVKMVGTPRDWEERFGRGKTGPAMRQALLDFLYDTLGAQGEVMEHFGFPSHLPFKAANDFAASFQAIYTASFEAAARAIHHAFETAGLPTRALCLGGGGALNRPTNAVLIAQNLFADLFIPPYCEDGGLSLGAAFWLIHTDHGLPRAQDAQLSTSAHAMLGPSHIDKIFLQHLIADPHLDVTTPLQKAESAANDLANNKIIGWYEGGSEAGPHALGHRSIFASPADKRNAARINALKGREAWRPVAPICSIRKLSEWCEGGPPASPFMLFDYKIRKTKAGLIPAVVQPNGMASIQTIQPEDGAINALLECFENKTGLPILINAALKSALEPIVEAPQEAVDFFRSSKLDVLYLEHLRIEKIR